MVRLLKHADREFCGDVAKLTMEKLPKGEDEPDDNFFFDAGTDGGRLLLDLGSVIRSSG